MLEFFRKIEKEAKRRAQNIEQLIDDLGVIPTISKILAILTPLAAILFVAGIVYVFGFYLTHDKIDLLRELLDVIWWIFLVNVAFRFVVDRDEVKKHRGVAWIVGVLFLISLLLRLFGGTEESGKFMIFIGKIVSSDYYTLPLLGFYALTTISSTIVGFISRKTTPALLLSVSFFFIIVVGALLLLLPRSTHDDISIVNALFVATSAVCVTGLTPIDISTVFTIEGQLVIAFLIQIGGLGVMTLTSFFALFFMGNTGLYNHLALRNMISSESLGSLFSTLIYILGFTLFIEVVGMFLIWITVHGTMGMSLSEELFFSGFHSISAFCNAGFSTLPGNLGNPLILGRHTSIYLIISFLVILGGIGFPILVNFKEVIIYRIKRVWKNIVNPNYDVMRIPHITNINSRIVLRATLSLILFGTVAFALFEWNGAFADMDSYEKIVHSFFNSVSPRTAGFNSVDLTGFTIQALMIYMFLMWIGGGAQSTAGGIKVNVFYVAILNLLSVLKSTKRVDVFGRELSDSSIRRANATLFISIIIIGFAIFTLTILEPDIPVLHLIFESISAIGTVGSSLNTTHLLGDGGKLLIVLLMFVGRIGVLIVFLSFMSQNKSKKYRYPQGHIIIN